MKQTTGKDEEEPGLLQHNESSTDEDSGAEPAGAFVLCTRREGCIKPSGHKGRCRRNLEQIRFAEDHVQCPRNTACVNPAGHRGRCKLRAMFESNGVLMGSPIMTKVEIKKEALKEGDDKNNAQGGEEAEDDDEEEEEETDQEEEDEEIPKPGSSHVQCPRNSRCAMPAGHRGWCRTLDNKLPSASPRSNKRPGPELERIKKEDMIKVADSEEEESGSDEEMEVEEFALPSWTNKRPRQGMGGRKAEKVSPFPAALKKEALEAAKGGVPQYKNQSKIAQKPVKKPAPPPAKEASKPQPNARPPAPAAGPAAAAAGPPPGPPPRGSQQAPLSLTKPTAAPSKPAPPGPRPTAGGNPAGRALPPQSTNNNMNNNNNLTALPPVPASAAAFFQERVAPTKTKAKPPTPATAPTTNTNTAPSGRAPPPAANAGAGAGRPSSAPAPPAQPKAALAAPRAHAQATAGPSKHPAQAPAMKAPPPHQQQHQQQQQQQQRQQQQRNDLVNGTVPHSSHQQLHPQNKPTHPMPVNHNPPPGVGGGPPRGPPVGIPSGFNSNLSSSLIKECRELEAALAHCGLSAYDRLIYSMKFATLPVEVRMAHWDAVQRHIAEGNTLAVVVAVREQIRSHL